MRTFILSFYPFLFILASGIPVNLDSNEINLDSNDGEIAYNPPQQPIEAPTQTLSQSDNVALANPDSIFQNSLDAVDTNSNNPYTDTTAKQTYQNPTQSESETTSENLSQVPTQSGYDTNGELMAIIPSKYSDTEETDRGTEDPSTAVELSPSQKGCLKRSLKQKKPLCGVPSWVGAAVIITIVCSSLAYFFFDYLSPYHLPPHLCLGVESQRDNILDR